MSKLLEERLRDAKDTLDLVDTVLGRDVGKLSTDANAAFRRLVDYRAGVGFWLDLLKAREIVRSSLDGLEKQADGDELVPFGKLRAKFHHVRFIGVQAYISTSWALADQMTGMVGRILCTPKAGRNDGSPAQLVTHFVQKENTNKMTVAGLCETVRESFGWPIGISYAIRNHFVHEGAHLDGSGFFDGNVAASAFRISSDGWNRIESKAQTYGVESSLHRAGAAWPSNPRDDLRELLKTCEREIDDCLGILIGSASRFLSMHVQFMLGDD